MFRAKNGLRFVRWASTKKFIVNDPKKGFLQKNWVPITIFGGSFFTGWLLTQHMTFTDVIAYWKYDKLPQDTAEVLNYQADLTSRLSNLPIVEQLKSSGYSEVVRMSSEGNNLIDATLQTPGGIAIAPKFYYNPRKKETVGIYHLGMKLTGYPFLVHGGILATIMEDQMRESVKFIKNKPGEKTKELSVSYKMPTFANQFVIVRTTGIEEYGKNVKLSVDVMDQSGNRKLVEGKGVFST